MFLFLLIPFFGAVGAGLNMIIHGVLVVGGLIIAPSVLKASSNVINLIKDGKIGLDAQRIIKKISEYDEQIGTIVIDKKLKFKQDILTKEIQKIKENISKLEEKNKALEELKTSNQ